ncbi:MAG TPA: glycosyltransferase [Candidatus Hydrogenedentes bacterium]|nr:glycosyltransferase [Candidatus Hydrogenedentota bacterium]
MARTERVSGRRSSMTRGGVHTRLKILHVYKDFDPPIRGGMERHVALMCRYQSQWAEVEALTCSRSVWTRRAFRDGTRVTEVGEWGRFQSAPIAPLFPWHLRKLQADIIVAHVPNPTAELSYLIGRPQGRLIVRYQSDVVRQAAAMRFYGPFQMTFLRKAAMILVASEQYLATSPTLQAVRDRCVVVPLGIVPEDFQRPDAARVAALRAKYGGEYVLFLGMHRYYKGLEYLVRAAPSIRAMIVMAGGGPQRPYCESLTRTLGANIVFPGTLSHEEAVDHLHGCAVFVFPSVARSEAYGISMLEAHACGKPVVATTLGTGVEFVNLHGRTGLNVPPRDPAALAEAVNALLADPELRDRMGAFAQRRVETELHAATIARREFELYQQA